MTSLLKTTFLVIFPLLNLPSVRTLDFYPQLIKFLPVEGQKAAVENLMKALANAAKSEDVAKIAALTKEIQQAIVDVEESKVSKNAVAPLRNEFESVGG